MKFSTYKKPWVVGAVCLGLVVGGVMCLRPTKKPATDKAVPNSAVNTPSIHHVTPIILPVLSCGTRAAVRASVRRGDWLSGSAPVGRVPCSAASWTATAGALPAGVLATKTRVPCT